MTTLRTDAETARWMNTLEFQHCYEEWRSQFNVRLLRDPRPPDRAENRRPH